MEELDKEETVVYKVGDRVRFTFLGQGDMKWWQKKVRGWTVPFWYVDTPLFSKRFAELSEEERRELSDRIRKQRRKY